HAALLRELVARLAADPEAALPHARALAGVDPLDDGARAGLVRLLAATGRPREAEQQYEAAARLRKELGGPSSEQLEAAWRGGPGRGASSVAGETDRPAPPLPAGAGLVGRAAERGRLDRILDETAHGGRERVVLLCGEPGLGKTRLLEVLR